MKHPTRKHLSSKEKIRIVKKHLVERKPISELCEAEKVLPGSLHLWVKELWERGEYIFEMGKRKKNHKDEYERKIAAFEAKLVQKNEVIAELMQENIKLKKLNGEI